MSVPERRRVTEQSEAAERTVLGHVREEVAELRARLAGQGVVSWPPTLALGTFERVGSNWFLDAERVPSNQHNEPFRQQLHPTHCLSPVTTGLVPVDSLSVEEIQPFALHWLTAFVATKHHPVGQLVKETNLFFAADGLLKLFPDAELVVLCRSPVGIASSFERGDLFTRWGYAARYHQIRELCRTPRWCEWMSVLPDDRPTDLQMLARLIVLNTSLLSQAIGERAHSTLAYEARFAAEGTSPLRVARRRGDAPTIDDTFDTRRPPARLTSYLTPAETRALRQEVDRTLGRVDGVTAGPALDRARRWLADDPRYTAPSRRSSRPRRQPERQHPGPAADTLYVPSTSDELLWRSTLVTNREVAAFLNRMANKGLANVIDGVHLFVNEAMPVSRGGRIQCSPATGAYEVSAGFDEHPAYWITWLGAATYAVVEGARLPRRDEIENLVRLSAARLGDINADHRVGDVTAAVEPGKALDAIHHRLGNLQVWCADGPPTSPGGVHRRYFFGIAWDTPATQAELTAVKARHITGCSRGIGVRLVRDRSSDSSPVTDSLLAARIREALASFGGGEPLDQQEEAVLRAITPGFPS